MNKIIRSILLAVTWCMTLSLSAQTSSFSEKLPDGRPDAFPVPAKKDNSLFFIQRNKNENTIVYDANLTSQGGFNSSKPIDVYWLRFASNGSRMELTWLQRNFAYGYKFKKDENKTGYWITLTAYDGRKIHLEKDRSGKPIATMTINGKYCRLNYIWAFADDSGSWPKVFHVDIHGKDMITGKIEVERINN